MSKYVDWDEMIGFIMRKADEKDTNLMYQEVKVVLDSKKEYMANKNITYKIEDD